MHRIGKRIALFGSGGIDRKLPRQDKEKESTDDNARMTRLIVDGGAVVMVVRTILFFGIIGRNCTKNWCRREVGC